MIDAECQRAGQITVSSTGTFKGQTYIGVIGIFTRRAAEVQCRGLGACGRGWGLGGLCYVSTLGGGRSLTVSSGLRGPTEEGPVADVLSLETDSREPKSRRPPSTVWAAGR